MNQLNTQERSRILQHLVEGLSICSTARLTGFRKETISKLVCDIGPACQSLHNALARNLAPRRIQLDEVWTFVYAKDHTLKTNGLAPDDSKGSKWQWIAFDPDSKFNVQWHIGNRTLADAILFLRKLHFRLREPITSQLISDGYTPYIEAVATVFGTEIDYGMLVKIYGTGKSGIRRGVIGTIPARVFGNLDLKRLSTSFVERYNLTLRMNNRRLTRKTNGFSKKFENLVDHISLYSFYYNFCRVHQSCVRLSKMGRYSELITPAMNIGIADHVWTMEELINETLE